MDMTDKIIAEEESAMREHVAWDSSSKKKTVFFVAPSLLITHAHARHI